jgi:endoglucanase
LFTEYKENPMIPVFPKDRNIMRLLKPLFLTITMFIFLLARSQQLSFLKAEGKRIVNEKEENVLLRGIGLGGWMIQEGYMLHLNKEGQQYRVRQRIEQLLGKEQTSEFYSAWLSNNTTKSDIDSLHAWGFNSVRLPMHYNLFTLAADEEPVPGKNTWLTIGFTLTDSLISWCRANHMYVFLDLHAAPGGQGNDLNISDRDPAKPSLWQSESNKQKTISFWKKIAERYANEPTVGGYDILNEPNWGFEDTLNDRNGLKEKGNQPLRQLLMDITTAIREVDKKHIIIIEGNGWGNNYAGMMGPWDNNMVLSFHKYWNYNNQQSIQHILDYREKYKIPVWIGETGENSNTWYTEAIRLFEDNNIGWSWWPLKKMGNNNPLQIRSNPDYDVLLKYWTGKTPTAPAKASVYKGLMELAADTKCERNIVHQDVIDAMTRQPFSSDTKPFRENNILPGSVLLAADYDLGVIGKAYYDLDSANFGISSGKEKMGNRGRVYRNDGVDIYEDSLQKGVFYVGHTEDGEWLQYTIHVLKAGKYKIRFSVSSIAGGGEISLSVNNTTIPFNLPIPPTGADTNWQTVIFKNLELAEGTQQIRVHIHTGGFNISKMVFEK